MPRHATYAATALNRVILSRNIAIHINRQSALASNNSTFARPKSPSSTPALLGAFDRMKYRNPMKYAVA